MRKIIIFSGIIGSGKDTLANYFIKHGNYVLSKMAGSVDRVGSLKRVVFEIFNLDMSKVEDRVYREEPNKNLGGKTPREALQYFGHLTREFLDTTWINNTLKHIKSIDSNIVLTDIRYLNELEAIRSLQDENTSVYLISVIRPNLDTSNAIYSDASEHDAAEIGCFANYTVLNNADLKQLDESAECLFNIIDRGIKEC